MKMKKKAAILTSLALLLAVFSGCSKEKVAEKQPVTITVWTYYNGAQLTAFSALVDQFNHTVGAEEGITVVSSSQGSVNDLETNVLACAEGKVGAGEIPDIFAAYTDTAYKIDQMGLAADLRLYLTDEEVARYVDSYMEEGHFYGEDGIKIFPIAKSVELFLLNKTDWEPFAEATGATYDDFSTIEGLTATAQAYYEWTDSLTPEPNDGKAFFGRDAMANYMLIGSMQLGVEMFEITDEGMTLHFKRDIARKLWDNYYVPYVKGYFSSSGRFRSDDVKTGNIISFIGSSSGATFFPTVVNLSDTESHSVEMEVFPCPQFEGGQPYAVQQGAGMVVTKGSEEEIEASVTFLKWFTENEQNIRFSVDSGYLPVQKSGNAMDAVRDEIDEITPNMEKILTVAFDTVNHNTLYTPKAFAKGSSARKTLEYSLSDLASADRAVVKERLAEGWSLEEAAAEFLSDAYFEEWYLKTLAQLDEYAG